MNLIIPVLYFVTCVGMMTSAIAAESPSAESWSIQKILARALERSPEFKALVKDIERAENLARQAGRWDNPEASVSYGPMTQSGLNGHSFDVSIKQSIPIFGQKSIAEDIGLQNKVTVEADSKKQRLALLHEVVRLAYRLSALEEHVMHIVHRRDRIKLIAEFLKTRPFASPSQAVEKSLILNRLREIEEDSLKISAAREGAWQALNIFLGFDSRISPIPQWRPDPKLPDRNGLWKQFENQNPEIEKQKSLIVTAELEADQAGKRGLPDIRIGAGYNEQTAELPQRTYGGTIDFSIPIFDSGSYGKRAALAEKEAATYRLEQKRRELQAQFDQTWTVLQHTKKRVELFPLTLVASQETHMTKAEQNWRKGLVPVTSFLELETQVHEQATKVFDAQVEFIEALSQMQYLAGVEFSAEEK